MKKKGNETKTYLAWRS